MHYKMKHNIMKKENDIASQGFNSRRSLAKSASVITVATGLAVAGLAPYSFNSVYAEETTNTTFQVNVKESVSVSITTPSAGATGNVNTFLRNQIDLSVDTNSANGFTASMYSKDSTNLSHNSLGSSYNIPTLASSSTRGSFPADRWGYSLASASLSGNTYGETSGGNDNSYYYPLVSTSGAPITVLSGASGTKTGTQSIYFGSKASAAKPSGTYSNTVVISVVTGVIDSNTNPATPTNPDTPSTDTTIDDSYATYTGSTGTGATQGVGSSGSTGTTVYTVTSSNSTNQTETTTTEITAGDNTSAYPKGVSTLSDTNIADSSASLPLGLAVTAASAATTGLIFFIVAKKRDDDDEEEQQQQ